MNLSIREFGLLSANGEDNGLDYRTVPGKVYSELRASALRETDQGSSVQFLRLTSRQGVECVQACNYVGLIQTTDGCQIEILPKTSILPKATNDSAQTTEAARKLLWRMLQTVFDIKDVQSGDASLETLNRNWLEVLIQRALNEISRLVRRGICSNYVRRVEQSRFLKGQFQVSRQLRLGPGRQDRFCVSYDQYLPDRAENRLIHSALNQLSRWTQLPDNQRLCRELSFVFSEPLPVFGFGGALNLWAVPFDLDKDTLIAGEWPNQWMRLPGGCTPHPIRKRIGLPGLRVE